MERRGRLTYERLVNSLERLHGAVEVQFPESKDIERVQDLQQVIKNALTAARAGMSGGSVASPVQLKREVEARIVEVHERYNEVDQHEEPSNDDTRHNGFHSSAVGTNHTSPSSAIQETPAPRRTPHSPHSGKENATPSAAPSRQPPTKKPSAVKKTTITKRATSKKPSTAAITKRTSRPTRNKPTVPPPTATPLPATDEADRRAAAAALLGLAEHSPSTSFVTAPTSSSSALTPSTSSKKRARSVYEDDGAFSNHDSQNGASSSPVLKRRVLAPGMYALVPRLDEGVSVQRAFAMGVEYALEYLSMQEGFEGREVGVGLREWVGRELGLRDGLELERSLDVGRDGGYDGAAAAGDLQGQSIDAMRGGSGGKGFWDVV